VNTLQFIDSMTNRLAWPLSAIVLGLIFRPSLVQLLGRVRRLKWGEKEAELAELAEAANDVQEAVAEAAAPLPDNAEQREAVQRERIERLMRDSAQWGFRIGQTSPDITDAEFVINWDGEQPLLGYRVTRPASRQTPWEVSSSERASKAAATARNE
jgi:hypothetical protein